MTIELTPKAYEETNWGNSTYDWKSYTPPSSWMEDLAELIEKKLLASTIETDKPNKLSILREIRRVTRDPICGTRVETGLKQVYAIVINRIQDSEITFDPEDLMEVSICMEKIYERVIHCPAGAENGLNEVLRSWRQPKNLAQRLEKYRTQIMMKLAINITDEVHGQNEVTKIAFAYDNNKFGIKINNPNDPYSHQDWNFPPSQEIEKRLESIFQQEYTPLLIIKSLEEQYKEYMYGLGYIGNKSDGYKSAVYGPIKDYLNKQFGAQEDWMIKDNDKVIDVNWTLVRRKIVEQLNSEGIITKDASINNPQQILPKINNLEEIKYWCSLNPDNQAIQQWIESIKEEDKSTISCMLLAFLPTESAYLNNKQKLIDANKANYQKLKMLLLSHPDYLKSVSITQSLGLSFQDMEDETITNFFFVKEAGKNIFSLLHEEVNSSACIPMYSLLINQLQLTDYLSNIEEDKRAEVICKVLFHASPGTDKNKFIQQIKTAVQKKKINLGQLQDYVLQNPELNKSDNFISSFVTIYEDKEQLRHLLFSKIRIRAGALDEFIFRIIVGYLLNVFLLVIIISVELASPEFRAAFWRRFNNIAQYISSTTITFIDHILQQSKKFISNTAKTLADKCSNLDEYQALFRGKFSKLESICNIIEYLPNDHALRTALKQQLADKTISLEELLHHLFANPQLMDSEAFVANFIDILKNLDSDFLKQNDAIIFGSLLPYGNPQTIPKLLEVITQKYTLDEIMQKYTPVKRNDFFCLLISYQPEGKYMQDLVNYINDQPQQLASYLKDQVHHFNRPEFLTNLTKILENGDVKLEEIIQYEPNLVNLCLEHLHPSNVDAFLKFLRHKIPNQIDRFFSKFDIWRKNIESPPVVLKLLEFMRENKQDIPYKKINKVLRHHTEKHPSEDAEVLQDRFIVQSDLYHHGAMYGTPTTFHAICTKGDVCLLLDSQILADTDFVTYIQNKKANAEFPLYKVIIENNSYSEPLITKITSLPKDKAQRILSGKSLSNDNVLMSLMCNKNSNNLLALTSLLKTLTSGSFDDDFILGLFNYPKGASVLTLASSLNSKEPYISPSFLSVLLNAVTQFKPAIQKAILDNCKAKEIKDVNQRIDLLIIKVECDCITQEDEGLLSPKELSRYLARIEEKPKAKEYLKQLLLSREIDILSLRSDKNTFNEFAKRYTFEEYLSLLPKDEPYGKTICALLENNPYPETSKDYLDKYFNELIKYLENERTHLASEKFRSNFLLLLGRQDPIVVREYFADVNNSILKFLYNFQSTNFIFALQNMIGGDEILEAYVNYYRLNTDIKNSLIFSYINYIPEPYPQYLSKYLQLVGDNLKSLETFSNDKCLNFLTREIALNLCATYIAAKDNGDKNLESIFTIYNKLLKNHLKNPRSSTDQILNTHLLTYVLYADNFDDDIMTIINKTVTYPHQLTAENFLENSGITTEQLIKFINTSISNIKKAPNSNVTNPPQTKSPTGISDKDRDENIIPVVEAPVVLQVPMLEELDEKGYLNPQTFFLDSNEEAITSFYEELEAKDYDFAAYLNLFDTQNQPSAVDAILKYDTNQTYIYDAGLMQYLVAHDIKAFKNYLTDNDKAFKIPLFLHNLKSIVPALTGEQLHIIVQAPLTHDLISFLMKNLPQVGHEIDLDVKAAISNYVHINAQSFIAFIEATPQLMSDTAFITTLTTILSESDIPEQLSSFIPLYERTQDSTIAQEAYEKLSAKYQNNREFGTLGLKIFERGASTRILKYVPDIDLMRVIKKDGVELLARLIQAKDLETLQKSLKILGQVPLDEDLIISLFTSKTEIDNKNYTLITLADSLDHSNATGTQASLPLLLDLVGKCSEETQKAILQSVTLSDLHQPDIIVRKKSELNMENILPTSSYELCLLFKKIKYEDSFKQYASLFSRSDIVKNLLNNYDSDTCLLFWQILSENKSLLNPIPSPEVFTNMGNLVALVNDSDDLALEFLFEVIQENPDISKDLIQELESSDNKLWANISSSPSKLLNLIKFFESQKVEVPYKSILKNCVMEDNSTQTPEELKNLFFLEAHLYKKLGYSKVPDAFITLCKQHDLAKVIDAIKDEDLNSYIVNSENLMTDMLNNNYANFEILMNRVMKFGESDKTNIIKSMSILYADKLEHKFKILRIRQQINLDFFGYFEKSDIMQNFRDVSLESVIDDVTGVKESESLFIEQMLELISLRELHFNQAHNGYIKLLKLVNSSDNKNKKQLLHSIKLDEINDNSYYKNLLIALKDSLHLLNLDQVQIDRLGDKFKNDPEMPWIIQLRFKDTPDEIMQLLKNHSSEFKKFTYTEYDRKHLNKVLKPEHWYEIAKSGLLPLDVLKHEKEAVLEHIRVKSDQQIVNEASKPGSSIYTLFSTPRGTFGTSKSRGTLKKLEQLQEEMERNEKNKPPQST